MKRDIEDIIKDIDSIDSKKKISELMDALKARNDELMCNDDNRIMLMYKRLLDSRRSELEIITKVSEILKPYVICDNKVLSDKAWESLKNTLFPQSPSNYRPVLSTEEFDRLYPDRETKKLTVENLEFDPFFQMLKIAMKDENDTPSV